MKNRQKNQNEVEVMWFPLLRVLAVLCSRACNSMVPGGGVEPPPVGFSDRCCGPQVSYPGI